MLELSVSRRVRVRFRRAGPMFYALAAQAALILIAVFVVVMEPVSRSEPEFTAAPAVSLPQKQLEHQMAVADFQAAAGPPSPLERLAVDALLPDQLPALPKGPDVEWSPFEATDPLMGEAQALLAAAGLGAWSNLSGAGSASAFFGIEDAGDRIVVVVNTSASVMRKARSRGVTIERLQEELFRLVDGLDGGALFGVVQFSQGVRSFAPHLAPATARNREALQTWARNNLRGNPPAPRNATQLGHEAALAAALAYEPDIIFLVTDGKLNRREGSPGRYSYPEIPYESFRSALRDLDRANPRSLRIHVIGFEMETAHAENMRRLSGEFGGQLREF